MVKIGAFLIKLELLSYGTLINCLMSYYFKDRVFTRDIWTRLFKQM